MSEFTALLGEFKQLKGEIFAQGDFVVIEDVDDIKMQGITSCLDSFTRNSGQPIGKVRCNYELLS